jgi:uncharacterized protein
MINGLISGKLKLPFGSVKNTIELLERKNTIPFIARYRKEKTGNLDELQIQDISELYIYYKTLEERKNTIRNQLKKLDCYDDEKEKIIADIMNKEQLEDFYEPYKPKRKTLAQKYFEAGLKPFAQKVKNGYSIDFKRDNNTKIVDEEEFYKGISIILADEIYLDINIKKYFRDVIFRHGKLVSKVKRGKKEEGYKYDRYFDYVKKITYLKPYAVHAILRGEKVNILNLSILINEEWAQDFILRHFFKNRKNEIILNAIKRAISDLILPFFLREVRDSLKKKADLFSIEVYKRNVIDLLMLPPQNYKIILGIDPGIRTGHKYVVIKNYFDILENGVFKTNNLEIIKKLIGKYNVDVVAVGNGTGSGDLFWLLHNNGINVFLVNEDGASIYSASEEARKEFSDYDITVRGAISIARRFIDPLNEYVKIPIQALGVGEYQYDINKKMLNKKLEEGIYFAVNKVGVDLNRASEKLLSYVSGFNEKIAKNIFEFRSINKPFDNKKSLLKVKGIGEKIWEQAEGFLRIKESNDLIENTGIIEEYLPIVEEMEKLEERDFDSILRSKKFKKIEIKQLKEEFSPQSVEYIHNVILHFGEDIRLKKEFEPFIPEVKNIEDLKIGDTLKVRIKNITSFALFCDSGAHFDIMVPGNYLQSDIFVGKIINIYIENISKKGISSKIKDRI